MTMTPSAHVHPHHVTWMGLHKGWTTVLVVLALAIAVGAILCTIY